jgi:hypothetical protein
MPLTTFKDDSMNPAPRPHLRLLPATDSDYDSAGGGARQPAGRFESPRRIGVPEPEPLPDHLHEEMRQADALWQTLHERDRQLAYEVDEDTGRVTAELRDLAGATLRLVALTQALGASDDDCPAA